LSSIYKVYISKTLFYKVINIVQKDPKILQIKLLVKKDFDFLSWLNSEVVLYKNINQEADVNIEYILHGRKFLMNLGSTIFLNMKKVFSIKLNFFYSLIVVLSLIGFIYIMYIMGNDLREAQANLSNYLHSNQFTFDEQYYNLNKIVKEVKIVYIYNQLIGLIILFTIIFIIENIIIIFEGNNEIKLLNLN